MPLEFHVKTIILKNEPEDHVYTSYTPRKAKFGDNTLVMNWNFHHISIVSFKLCKEKFQCKQ